MLKQFMQIYTHTGQTLPSSVTFVLWEQSPVLLPFTPYTVPLEYVIFLTLHSIYKRTILPSVFKMCMQLLEACTSYCKFFLMSDPEHAWSVDDAQ